MKPSRRRALTRDFDRTSARIEPLLAARLGAEEAESLAAEAKRRHAGLIEEIPVRRTLLDGARDATYAYLAYTKVLQERGFEADEIGPLFHESWDVPVWVKGMPGWLRHGLLRLLFGFARRRFRKDEKISRDGSDPHGFAFELLESGEGQTDLAFDITECAICKSFARHGAEEVVPYLCALDDKMSRTLGLGLRRSSTQALGAARCDFRYRIGGEPRPVQGAVTLPVIEDRS